MRVSALIGIKKIDCDVEYLVPGELPPQLEGLVKQLTVPMLELQDETGAPSVMQESGDIIRYLDQLDGQPLLESYEVTLSLSEWLSRISKPLDYLCYPRMPALDLPELSSEQAQNYFKASREELLGMTLTEALNQTGQWLEVLRPELESLSSVLMLDGLISGKRKLQVDDLNVFSILRSLSMVNELVLPESVSRYLDYLTHATGLSLYPKISAEAVTLEGGD